MKSIWAQIPVWLAVGVGSFLPIFSVASAADASEQTPTASTAVSKKSTGPERFAKEIAAFTERDRETPPLPGGIVFVGSSSIRRWPLEQSFPDLPVINRGFGGSHLADSVYYLDQIVVPHRPRIVVLYAGDNDLAAGKTPEQVASDFQAFYTQTRAALPQAKIILLSIKPSPKRKSLRGQQQATNRMFVDLVRQASDERLIFVDLVPVMLDAQGEPRPELFVGDQLHVNDAGYAIWAKLLRPHLE